MKYLHSINYFRAVAIIFVVAGHVYHISGFYPTGYMGGTFVNFIQGGTYLFLFISGFLFQHIFVERYNYKKFIKSKVRNILKPYLFLSIIPVCMALYLQAPYGDYFFEADNGLYFRFIRPTILYLLTGRHLTAYWYIPFIMLLFVISPVFVEYSKLNLKKQLRILIPYLLISGFVHRSINNINILHDLFYFVPFFMFGIVSSKYQIKLFFWLNKKYFLFGLVAVFLAFLQIKVSGSLGSYHKGFFEFNGFDLQMTQKFFLCLFFLGWLNKFEGMRFSLVSDIADASFAIYFLHVWLIFIFKEFGLNNYLVGIPLLNLFVLTGLTIILSYSIALLIKRNVPFESRAVIGW